MVDRLIVGFALVNALWNVYDLRDPRLRSKGLVVSLIANLAVAAIVGLL
jgi:hypothetical protein